MSEDNNDLVPEQLPEPVPEIVPQGGGLLSHIVPSQPLPSFEEALDMLREMSNANEPSPGHPYAVTAAGTSTLNLTNITDLGITISGPTNGTWDVVQAATLTVDSNTRIGSFTPRRERRTKIRKSAKSKGLTDEEKAAFEWEDNKKLEYRLLNSETVYGVEETYGMPSANMLQWRTFIEKYSPIIEAMFPGDWELRFARVTEDQYDEDGDLVQEGTLHGFITVLYHDITVTRGVYERNGRKVYGASHDIKEMYVKIKLNSDCCLTSGLMGCRGQLTWKEHHNTYAHSHLSSIGGFTTFCQGDTNLRAMSSEIGQTPFVSEDNKVWEDGPIMLEAYLHQLQAFIGHEATQGTPYRRISGLRGRSVENAISSSELAQNMANFLRKAVDEHNPFPHPLPFSFENGIPQLIYNDEMEANLCLICRQKQLMDMKGKLYTPAANTSRYGTDYYNTQFQTFNFRGNEVKQLITYDKEEAPPQQAKTEQQYCHLAVREYIIGKVNGQIRNSYAKASIEPAYEARQREHLNNAPSGKRKNSSSSESWFKALELASPDKSHGVERSDVLQDDAW